MSRVIGVNESLCSYSIPLLAITSLTISTFWIFFLCTTIILSWIHFLSENRIALIAPFVGLALLLRAIAIISPLGRLISVELLPYPLFIPSPYSPLAPHLSVLESLTMASAAGVHGIR